MCPVNTKEPLVELGTVVGKSYNTLESPYIIPRLVNTKNPVLDMSKAKLTTKYEKEDSTDYVVGDSLKEIADKFSASVTAQANIMLFSGSISTDFKRETKSEHEMAYCKATHLAIRKRINFTDVDQCKDLLTDKFKENLNSLDVETFFKRYGTHLIVEASLGGRLEFNFSREKKLHETKESLEVEVKAGLGKALKTETSISQSNALKELSNNNYTSSRVIGGMGLAITTFDSFNEQYKKWVDSLENEKNWQFCSIPNMDSLVPLWDFCETKDEKGRKRRNELKRYYEEIVNLKGNVLQETELYVKDIMFVNHKNIHQAKANCPSDYILIDKDLNAGSGGDYIYLCYKLAPMKNKGRIEEYPITNCVMEETKDSKRSSTNNILISQNKRANYYRDGLDLNKGSGGNYIYFYHTKDRQYLPIKRLAVTFDSEPIAKEDWEIVYWKDSRMAADCNKSSGGDYIWIYMNRDKEYKWED